MRHYRILLYLIALSAMAGCIRRPFSEQRTEVHLEMEVNLEVQQEIHGITKPELMKVCLCDRTTGEIRYTDYLPPEGGYIYPQPGVYDILVYNINTESTEVKNENNMYTTEAFTSEISAFIKGQLRPFLNAREKIRLELMKKRQEEAQKNANLNQDPDTKQDTKQETKLPEEKIANEPDHLFVGCKEDIVIPVMELGQTANLVIEMEAETIVETWHVKLANVKGTEYISEVSALLTGMVESTILYNKKDSDKPVTLFFEMKVGEDKKSLVATFRTFGKNPLFENNLELDLNVTDTGGNKHLVHFDVTDQFNDENDEHLILVEKEVVVEKPTGGGGGFAPEVDDWEDVNTDIII